MHEPQIYLQMLFLGGVFLTILQDGLCYDPVSDNSSILRYPRALLLGLNSHAHPLPSTLKDVTMPPEMLRNSCRKKRKRGRRGGVRMRCRRRANRAPLPPIVFGNVRSLVNKEDELAACTRFLHEYRESGIITLVETWMKEGHPDPHLPNFSCIRQDRTKDSLKERGGGLITFINDRWCKNITVKHRHCDPNVEILALGLRPYYLPREFTGIQLLTVYAPPGGDYSLAAETLSSLVTDIENNYPDSVIIITGDFNQCKFHNHIPHFVQYVKCNTRNDSMIDLFFCNVSHAYIAHPMSPLGNSDHKMMHCVPNYKPRYKSIKPRILQVHDWSDSAVQRLRGCFDCTNWSCLYDENDSIEWNTTVLTDYIKFCVSLQVDIKEVKCYANNKPWVTAELKDLINAKKVAIASKDKQRIKAAHNVLTSKIKSAKIRYKDKIEGLFESNDARNAWKGLKILSGFGFRSGKLPDVTDDSAYANELNSFYARFDVQNFDKERESLVSALKQIPAERVIIDENEVCKTLSKINTGKSPGPDKLGGKVLKECRLQLASPICKLYQNSIDTHVIPVQWLTSELVPAPKVPLPAVKNDLRPIALTAIIMKSFERIVLAKLNPAQYVDKLQFAYLANRSVEDANLTLHHKLLCHLDKPKSYVRLTFIDFSSAFNTIQPHILIQKLMSMQVNPNLILWIHTFLSNRPQYVRFKSSISNTITVNTGAPQGCVLSASLFTLYTSDINANDNDCVIVKYADDTIIAGLLTDGASELRYKQEVDKFVAWCDKNFLNLNVKKTKEMVIDFRKNTTTHDPVIIKGEAVELVNEYKYLGCMLNNHLSSSNHVTRTVKKANQRLFFVRKLRKLGVNSKILSLFYKSTVESVFAFCMCVWFGSCTGAERKRINKVARTAKRLGCDVTDPLTLYEKSSLKKLKCIMKDADHPLHSYVSMLPSGKRLQALHTRTSRRRNSFLPSAVRMHNTL